MWEGTADPKGGARTGLRKHAGYRESMTGHSNSRSDGDDDATGGFIQPPQPSGAAGFRNQEPMMQPSVAPANALLGSSFGSY
jgi:hypothetical protein